MFKAAVCTKCWIENQRLTIYVQGPESSKVYMMKVPFGNCGGKIIHGLVIRFLTGRTL